MEKQKIVDAIYAKVDELNALAKDGRGLGLDVYIFDRYGAWTLKTEDVPDVRVKITDPKPPPVEPKVWNRTCAD